MFGTGRGAPLYEVKAGLFKGLAHPIRIRVLEVLNKMPERDYRSVADVMEAYREGVRMTIKALVFCLHS